MRFSFSKKPIVYGIMGLGLLIFLETASMPGNTLLWSEIENLGHIPLFGGLSIILLFLVRSLKKPTFQKKFKDYILAFCVAAILGMLSEIIQIGGPRDPSISDFARDCTGSSAALLFYLIYDPGRPKGEPKSEKRFRLFALVATFVIVVPNMLPIAELIGGYLHRNNVFPQIISFTSEWEEPFLETRGARINLTEAPFEWTSKSGHSAGELEFQRGQYPGITVIEPYPNWVGYTYLRFNIYSELDTCVYIWIRIDDRHRNNSYEDRFNMPLTVCPGENIKSIPLSTIKNALGTRKMDMSAIKSICIFAPKPNKPFSLILGPIKLD